MAEPAPQLTDDDGRQMMLTAYCRPEDDGSFTAVVEISNIKDRTIAKQSSLLMIAAIQHDITEAWKLYGSNSH